MSRSLLFLIVAIFCIFTTTSGLCLWPWGGGTINVCKNAGKTNCLGVGSTNTCINLVGGPFISGFVTGTGYSCKIYSSTGCSGTSTSVDHAGWSRFPFTAKSFRCPCI